MKLISLPPRNICCGCGICATVCPVNIIKMIPDKEGFVYPNIQNTSLCISCGKCENKCPMIVERENECWQDDVKTYAGYIQDRDDLCKSASGGIATALSRKIISEGGVVFGVRYGDGGRKVHFAKAETEEELEVFRGSKYIQSEKYHVFSEVEEVLTSTDKPVLFIGLPCDIGALHSFLKKSYENLITVDLVCHGATSPKIADDYLNHLEQKYQSKVIEISVRYKCKGRWTPPYLYAKFENGVSYLKPFYCTEYGRAFRIFSRPSCYHCRFKGENHVADITLGDYWGCSREDRFYNSSGVSVIFTRTDKGDGLLLETSGITLIETPYTTAVKENLTYLKPRTGLKEREIFAEKYLEKGLFKAVSDTTTVCRLIFDYTWNYIPHPLREVISSLYKKCH